MSDAAHALGRELRRLRQQRGLSQRALTKSLGLSAHSNIADYEAGRRIPPRDIISACDRLLGTDGELGRLLTQALADKAISPDPAPPHASPPIPPVPLVSRAAGFTTRGGSAARDGVGALVAGAMRMMRRGRVWTVAVLVIAAVALLAWSLPRPEGRPVMPAASPSIWDGNDPKAAGCVPDAIILQALPVLTPSGQQLGSVHLRYSPACRAAWAKFEPLGTRPDGKVMVIVEAVRPADGMRTVFQYPSWDHVYGDLLETTAGCVQATATLRLADGTEATASTACLTA